MILMKRLSYIPAVMFMALAFISCEDDFNTIGSEIVGGHLDAIPKYEAGIKAYNKRLGPVQTNTLSAHLLGVYNEPVFGQQTANVLTQLSLPSGNVAPNFGTAPRLDSVVLTIPYYSTLREGNEEEGATYRLDSIYGNAPYRLSITRSGFFLNDLDPEANFENRQRYYSDQGPVFENNLIGEPLFVDEAFVPSSREVIFRQLNQSGEFDTISVSPRMRVQLPKEFWQENIIDRQGSSVLSNNNNFKNFLRGLYFKAEAINTHGNMLLLNFTHSDAGVILYYTITTEASETTEAEELQRSFRLSFGNNIVNTFEQEFPADVLQEIQSSNPVTGDANIYLKGGEGSMGIIELFEDEEELADLQSKGWLINEANIILHVNRELVPGGTTEPNRIYLFDIETNQVLLDYNMDPNVGAPNPNQALLTHAPVLERDEDGNGLFYKFRITNHVRRILSQSTPTSTRLGVVVIQNINEVNNAGLRTPEDGISRVPTGSLNTPKGTVLHGNLSSDASKRLQFNIYYTPTSN